MVGRVSSVSAVAGRYGIWTVATFDYPLVLKSPPGGPVSGESQVAVRFLGGTALSEGVCTRQYGNDLEPGSLYLVFAWAREGRAHALRFTGEASPVDDPTGLLTLRSGPRIYWPSGRPHALVGAVADIRAEVAREKAGTGAPKQ